MEDFYAILTHETINSPLKVEIPQLDNHTRTLQQRFCKKIFFAGAGIRTRGFLFRDILLSSGDDPQRLDNDLPEPVPPVRVALPPRQREVGDAGGDEHQDHASEVRRGKPVQGQGLPREVQGLGPPPRSGSILSQTENRIRRIPFSVQVVSKFEQVRFFITFNFVHKKIICTFAPKSTQSVFNA